MTPGRHAATGKGAPIPKVMEKIVCKYSAYCWEKKNRMLAFFLLLCVTNPGSVGASLSSTHHMINMINDIYYPRGVKGKRKDVCLQNRWDGNSTDTDEHIRMLSFFSCIRSFSQQTVGGWV